MDGFTFYLHGKDYFVETVQTRKTEKMAAKVLPLIGCTATPENIKALLYRMNKAVCEIKTCRGSGRTEKRYYDIHGEGFGGGGSWLDDGETIILKLN